MIISQNKRAYYDEDGSLAKMDIIHSIRRKDVLPTYSIQQQPQYENFNINKALPITYTKDQRFSKVIEFLRLFLKAIVVVTVILLFYSLFNRWSTYYQPGLAATILDNSTLNQTHQKADAQSKSPIENQLQSPLTNNEIIFDNQILFQKYKSKVRQNQRYTLQQFRKDMNIPAQAWLKFMTNLNKKVMCQSMNGKQKSNNDSLSSCQL